MNLSVLSTTQIAVIIAVVVVLAAGIAVALFVRKRRTQRLRTQFGGAEYARAMEEGGSRKKAEAVLDERAERVERFQIRPLLRPIALGLSSRGPECKPGLWTVPGVQWRTPTNCWAM